jgi:hypothetical protein
MIRRSRTSKLAMIAKNYLQFAWPIPKKYKVPQQLYLLICHQTAMLFFPNSSLRPEYDYPVVVGW